MYTEFFEIQGVEYRVDSDGLTNKIFVDRGNAFIFAGTILAESARDAVDTYITRQLSEQAFSYEGMRHN
jgi:hypothetical protein